MFKMKEAPMVNNSNQVQLTTNYSLFTSLDGNRNVNKLHVKRLKESMKSDYLFTVIIVNEKMQIIDGQHRYEACRQLQLPIRYIVVNGYGLKEVQILNQNSKNWNADDYLNGYCDLGNKHYLTYRDFKNKYGLGHNECQLLLAGKHVKGIGKEFSLGTFKVIQYRKACEYADKILKIKEFYVGWKRRSFVYAMIRLLGRENFDFDYFISKLKNQPNLLHDCTSVEQYIIHIEEVYNYRNRNKVSLRY